MLVARGVGERVVALLEREEREVGRGREEFSPHSVLLLGLEIFPRIQRVY